MSMKKIAMSASGIEPTAFRLVARYVLIETIKKAFKYLILFVLSCLSFQKHTGPLFGLHVHVIGVRFYYFLPVEYFVVA